MKIKVYIDHYARIDDPLLVGYKGKTRMDTALFYAPYVPLTMTAAVADRITSQGELWGWTTFIVNGTSSDVVEWCRENLGRQHRGIYLHGLKLWLGNGGRWRCDGRQEYEIGLIPPYTRIWLKREEDIVLFKMRWT